MDEQTRVILEKLRKIRTRTDLSIRPTKHLRDTIVGLDGVERPLKLRYYQVQMVLHLQAMKRFVVGDDTGCGKCCLESTLVLTDRGLLPMGEIEDWSDMKPDTFRPLSRPLSVLVDGEALPVRSFYRGGVKPTVTVTTRYGFRNGGSRVHPLMVRRDGRDQWVQMQNIREGDYLCIERREMPFPTEEPTLPMPDTSEMGHATRVYDVPHVLNPDLARLLGYIVGEGWPNHRYCFSVSQDAELNGAVRDDIRALIEQQFSYSLREHRDLTTTVSSVYLREYLRLAGVPDAVSKDKVVPWCVFRGTRASAQQFLRGLFEGEAHVSNRSIEITSASEELLRQVQVLLLRFGIVASRRSKRVEGKEHLYWRLIISGNDARLYHDHIGFVSARKNRALAEVVGTNSNPNRDVVPFAAPLVEALREEIYARSGRHGFKGEGIVKRWGVSFYNTLSHIRAERRNPTYAHLERMLQAAEDVGATDTEAYFRVKEVVGRKYFYDPVVKIEHGEEEVFDIAVDDPRHCFVGNGFVNHNTLEAIASLCYLWERNPDLSALILTKKSAIRQWASEFEKFTQGVNVFVCAGTPKQRQKVLEKYRQSPSPRVIVMGYRTLVQDFSEWQEEPLGVFIADEATVFKNPSSQVHQVCRFVASNAERAWGLTATLIKNNLVEGFGIYKVIHPPLFTHSPTAFIKDYCVVEVMNIGRGRKVPRVVGTRKSDVQRFRLKIEPFYLGRPKHEVASELPPLTIRTVKVGMSSVQHLKYQEALSGILELGTGEEKEVTKLTAVTYCQEIVNHPELIECEGKSEKLKELVDLLTEGDLEGDKVIVYTRFSKMVDIGIRALTKAGVKCVRITGAEDGDARKAAQDAFQDPKSDVRCVWITNAGNDAINLQMAKALVFYDTPFSAGDYLQTLGRMIRIGSIHDRVLALHLVVENSIDVRVMEIMNRKMELVEAVLGKRIKGEGDTDDSDEMFEADNEIDALFEALRGDAREVIGA